MDKNSRFLDIRKKLRLNQSELAFELDSSQNQISRFEKDKDFSFKILEILLVKYNININWLICGDGEMFLNECIDINVNNAQNSNVAINGTITIQTKDYIDSKEIEELLELLKGVPKQWIDKLLVSTKNKLKVFEEDI
jgi:transcriptional regulator with XRE-family HTH domain